MVGASKVILATTQKPEDDELVDAAYSLGIECFRGSEDDVLSRFYFALSPGIAKNIVRVCADNPFVDPQQIDSLISSFDSAFWDYGYNHRSLFDSSHVDGFGAEIISSDTLENLHLTVQDRTDREHVTSALLKKNDLRVLAVPQSFDKKFMQLKFDVDLEMDLVFLNSLADLGVSLESSADEILDICDTNDIVNESN